MTLPLVAGYQWFNGPRWRSWLGHTLMVLAIALVFGLGVALFCYFFREAEQALDKHAKGEPQDVTDNLLDVVVPMVAMALLSLVTGWV